MRDIPGKSKSSHPSLEGMEFDPDDFGKAIVALREAGESLFVSAHHGIPKAPGSNLVERLIASQDFRRAVRDNDRSAQLRICLEEITYDIWAYNYSTRTINLESAVRQDITDAKQAVAEIGHGPVDPNNFLTSTLNDRLARNPGSSPFILAMYILLEHRCQFQSEPVAPQPGTHAAEVRERSQTTTELDIRDILTDAPDPHAAPLAIPGHNGAVPEEIPEELDPANIIYLPQRSPQLAKTSSQSQLASGKCDPRPRETRDAEQLREELCDGMDRIITLIESIMEEKRHHIQEATPIVSRLMYDQWHETGATAMEICNSPEPEVIDAKSEIDSRRMKFLKFFTQEATDRGMKIPDLFSDDPQKENARKYLAELTLAIIAYEKTLRKLAAMEPVRRISQIEKDALLARCGMTESTVVDLIVADWLIQNYEGRNYIPARDLQALSLMKALGAMFPDSEQELFGALVASRFPSMAEATLDKAVGTLIQKRKGELQKHQPAEDAIASRDISEAREALYHYYNYIANAGGRKVDELVPIAYIGHVERIIAACNDVDGMTPGAAAIRSITHMRLAQDEVNATLLPESFKPATALLVHNYSRTSLIALATGLVDGDPDLELPSVNDPFDQKLESLLPEKTDTRTGRIRQAARSLNLCAFSIMPNHTRSVIWGNACPEAPSYAKILPGSGGISTSQRRIHTKIMMDALESSHKDMIARVMGTKEVTDEVLFNFLNLEAGIRECDSETSRLRLGRKGTGEWM